MSKHLSNISTNDSDSTTPTITKDWVEQEIRDATSDVRKDFMTVFGVFAALVTLAVIQVQIFAQPTRISIKIGTSSFFLASSLAFVTALHHILQGEDEWKGVIRPVFATIVLLILFSIGCFYYAIHAIKL